MTERIRPPVPDTRRPYVAAESTAIDAIARGVDVDLRSVCSEL
ncbi:hypothetical protein [Microbacterium soli]